MTRHRISLRSNLRSRLVGGALLAAALLALLSPARPADAAPASVRMTSLERAARSFATGDSARRWYEITPNPDRGLRDAPFLIAAGVDAAVDAIDQRRFAKKLLTLLRRRGDFSAGFLDYLRDFRFGGEIQAVAEGTVVARGQPLLRVYATTTELALIRDLIGHKIGGATAIATTTAQIVEAARGAGFDAKQAAQIKKRFGIDVYQPRLVSEQGLRRAQGVAAARIASRSAAIGGAASTSNVDAAKRYGLLAKGTMAHLFVTSFPSAKEIEAFRAYARAHPDAAVFLIDTYGTLSGAKNAALVGQELKQAGHQLIGVRLDSGDIAALSRQVRKILDRAGLQQAKIFASDDLDAPRIKKMLSRGAHLDALGVGTRMSTGGKQSYLRMRVRRAKGTTKGRAKDGMRVVLRRGRRLGRAVATSEAIARAAHGLAKLAGRLKAAMPKAPAKPRERRKERSRAKDKETTGLVLDKYHLTMANAFWNEGKHQEHATFNYYVRLPPFGKDHIVTSGLSFFLEHLKNFRFSESDIAYLREAGDLDPKFLDYLRTFRFRGDILAMREGSVAFGHEPVMQVTGNIIEASIIESLLLTTMNFNGLIATRAAHLDGRRKARSPRAIEDGLAVAQDGASPEVAWSAHVGARMKTTNLDAHLEFGVPLAGKRSRGKRRNVALATGGTKPALGGVFKLVEFGGEPRMKQSENSFKSSLPGQKMVWEIRDAQGRPLRRVIALEGEKLQLGPGEKAVAQLHRVVQGGEVTARPRSLAAIGRFSDKEQRRYRGGPKRATLSPGLVLLRQRLTDRLSKERKGMARSKR
jgi:putative nicotinate phosphoribosyltransferase